MMCPNPNSYDPRRLAICLVLLALTGARAHAQTSSDEPGVHGLAVQLRAVGTSAWTERYPAPSTGSYRNAAAYGLGFEVEYLPGGGVGPFVAADFNVLKMFSGGGPGFGELDGYGTAEGGIRVRHPISARVVPFAQASIARLRLAEPVYTQPFVGGGLELFVGHRTALRAQLELPVSGSSSLGERPRRLSVGMSRYLGHRESTTARPE